MMLMMILKLRRGINNGRTLFTYLAIGCALLCLGQIFRPKRTSLTFLDIYSWNATQTNFCQGNYVGYGRMFFRLRKTIYDPVKDMFSISCKDFRRLPNDYKFHLDRYAPSRYTKTLELLGKDTSISNDSKTETSVTMIIFREYPHNFYHAMTQWYNIYLVSKVLDINWLKVHVLLMDRGPVVHIDSQWKQIFAKVSKSAELTANSFLSDAVFNIAGHGSPMYMFSLLTLPFVDDFSADILRKFNLRNDKVLNCSNLTVTLVIRRDYFFHPEVDKLAKRNTQRKYKNDLQLLETLRSVFAGHTVRTMISESMSLHEQINLAVQTDVFIAMHGCALTHTLFLPSHATVLELYPVFWKKQFFFSSIAKWRRLKFSAWQNKDKNNEFPDHYTYIPPDVIVEYGARAKSELGCAGKNGVGST